MSENAEPLDSQQLQAELETARAELNAAQARIIALEAILKKEPVKVELQESAKQSEKSQSVAEIVKDQLVLIGSLIFFVGIIANDTYYNQFGINYQFLDLPTFHIIYRGLTILLDAWYIIIPYLIAVAWLGFDSFAILRNWRGFLNFRGLATYVLIFVLLIIAYPLATYAGRRQAIKDLIETTSTLPKIVYLKLTAGKDPASSETYGFQDRYRLLVIDSDFVVLFQPLKAASDLDSTLPNIKRYPKGEVNALETIRIR